jgi:signal transduction histidine kinase
MSTMENERPQKRQYTTYLLRFLAGSWLLFTVALIVWWYIFSQRQIERLSQAGGVIAEELIRNQKMLMWEGGTLLGSLILGGGALLYFIIRDQQHTLRLKEFFLTFTHELKTPIATLRLYAESLHDSLKDPELEETSRDLMREVDRLSLQLDNSLALSLFPDTRLHLENLSLQETLRPLCDEFDELTIQSDNDACVVGDMQALATILRNLLKNAVIHGHATTVTISCRMETTPITSSVISILDNGSGISDETQHALLGHKFQRLYRGSGSGIGLYLSKQLAEKMHGSLSFPKTPNGFLAELTLPLASTELS